MSRRLFISTVVFAIVLGTIIGYVRGMPDDFVDVPASAVDYGYRCGDGSEFTIVPSVDMSTIDIVPATSVEYFARTTLKLSSQGAYAGGDIVFLPNGTTAELTSGSNPSTKCTSMNPPETTLFRAEE